MLHTFDFTVEFHYNRYESFQKDGKRGRAIKMIELSNRVIEDCLKYAASFVWGEDPDFVSLNV